MQRGIRSSTIAASVGYVENFTGTGGLLAGGIDGDTAF